MTCENKDEKANVKIRNLKRLEDRIPLAVCREIVRPNLLRLATSIKNFFASRLID